MMSDNLSLVLEENRKMIIEIWTKNLKNMLATGYALRPLGELKAEVEMYITGYIHALEFGGFAEIRSAIDGIARQRSAAGFKLSEPRKASLLFKKVLELILETQYKDQTETFGETIRELDECLDTSLLELSEIYLWEWKELVHVDALTRLYNQGYFWHYLTEELKRARRYDHPVSILMVNADNLEEYLEAYESPAGNETLKK